MRSPSFSVAAATLALSLSVTLAACSDEAEPTAEDTAAPTETVSETAPETASATPTPSEPPSQEPSESDAGTGIAVTIKGDKITPAGERVEVGRGEVVTLEITSDRAGELHVHSKPDQYVEFEAGTSTHELTIDAPGVADVEDHDTGHVIVQLEVS